MATGEKQPEQLHGDVTLEVASENHDHDPEKRLTLVALRLALLEKSASEIGALGFVWATVVILGGFAITLEPTDFWLVTAILLVEGARIYSRSHELEWRHHSTASPFSSAFRRTRSRSGAGRNWALLSAAMSTALHWLQLLSAATCAGLSLSRLVRQDYGDVEKTDTDKRNRAAALSVFYGLALAEAGLFLAERAYWEYAVTMMDVLGRVAREYGMGARELPAVRRFFYDAYSRCVNGSVFDGLRMGMESFAAELVCSGSRHEQVMGVRVMAGLVGRARIEWEAEVVERLVEMVGWEGSGEVRKCAAQVVAEVAKRGRGEARVARAAGAVEAAGSLLHAGEWELPGLGLLILKRLARRRDGCERIATARALLPRIVELAALGESDIKGRGASEAQGKVIKRSLQLLKMLASTSGTTGQELRQEIAGVVFTIGNICSILRHGNGAINAAELQELGIEVLMSLAVDVDARERIGGTGGVVKELLRIFSEDGSRSSLSLRAGEALAMLAMESEGNCRRMQRLGVGSRLTAVLGDEVLGVAAGEILRNVCAYGGDEGVKDLMSVLREAAPKVLHAIMTEVNKPLLEAFLGLAAQILPVISIEEVKESFAREGISECDLARKLVEILRDHTHPSIKVPRMRRFAVELAIFMMRSSKNNIMVFMECGLKKELWIILDTTSEIELFKAFSGCSGLSRHETTMWSIVDSGIKMLEGN